ncbi:Mediator of RNA polymerase II transcription subunit 10 [Hordeum vulgare]|nr:Mediator of RNA polymerase II transcription subunit 10 [Hordeum vulgare]
MEVIELLLKFEKNLPYFLGVQLVLPDEVRDHGVVSTQTTFNHPLALEDRLFHRGEPGLLASLLLGTLKIPDVKHLLMHLNSLRVPNHVQQGAAGRGGGAGPRAGGRALAHARPDVLYVNVGDGDSDHAGKGCGAPEGPGGRVAEDAAHAPWRAEGARHAFDPDRRCWLRLPFTSFLPHQAFSPVTSSGSLLYLWTETGPPPAPLPSSSSSTSSPAASAAHPPKALAVCKPLAGTYRLLTSPWTTLPRTLLPPPSSPSPPRSRLLPVTVYKGEREGTRRSRTWRRNALVAELDTMQKLADGCNIQVPMEVVNLIDDGKNPDEFTKDVLNSCIAKNQITKGRTDAFKSLRKHLLEELEEAFPDDVEAYRQIRATSAVESKRLAQSQSALPNGDAKVKLEH